MKLTSPFGLRAIILFFTSVFSFTGYGQINTPANATKPFGSNVGYEYGILPSNVSLGDCEVITEYNNWKANYVENCGSTMARVKFDETWATVSEGIAYGMLLAAYAADKDLFNRLWAYYKNFRNQNGVMNWKISGCSTAIGFNGATDAELDASMALIVANKQWPNTSSPHNYVTDAKALINAIKNYEVAPDGTFYNGDMWHPDCRNPSYQSPAYARAFKRFMADNGTNQDAFWENVAVKTEALFAANAHATSGLNTNWSTPAGPPSSSCWGSGTEPDKFGYDACRAPWRQAVDILWYGPAVSSSVQNVVNRAVDFWITKGASNVQGGNSMNHDGTGFGDRNCAFWGPVGAQTLAASNTAAHQSFCNAMFTQNLNNAGAGGYFTKILQVLGLFVQSGNFWNPYAASSPGVETNSTATACNSYTWPRNGQTYTSSGTYTSTSGCTTFTLQLTINNCTNLNCSLVDAGSNTTISGSPLAADRAAFLSLVKVVNNTQTLLDTKPHAAGLVYFNDVLDGTYRLILHKQPNPTQVPTPELISGFTNFKFEGMQNSTGDNNPNGIIEIQLPAGTISPNAKILAGTLNIGFGLQAAAPLPIQLIEFKAKRTVQGNTLSWQTSFEKNIEGYDIEKSLDGSAYFKIARVTTNTLVKESKQYSYVDTETKTNSYYRLKILENQGKDTYSHTIYVSGEAGDLQFGVPYPNPITDGKMYLKVAAGQARKLWVREYDTKGQNLSNKLIALVAGQNVLELDSQNQNSGQLLYRFETEDGLMVFRVQRK